MKTVHYPNEIRSHLVTILPMAQFTLKSTSKLRFAPHFRYSIVILRFIPRANTAESYNNHYNHGLHYTFDYNHFSCLDYLLCTVIASAHIIHK